MADHLKLDAEGRLVPETEESRSFLKSRSGRWRVVPTTRDVTLLVREGALPAGQAITGPRCILSGEMGAIPAVDLAAFIDQQRRTGILWTRCDGVERSIWFKDGRVRWAASSNPVERLGEITVKLGLITHAQLEEISREQSHARRLGQLLVDRGLMNGHDLWKAIQHQITEVFWSFLMCHSGPFAFMHDAVDEKFAGHLSLDTQGLLMDGVRRLDEMKHFRRTVPETAFVRRKGSPKGEMGPLEQRIYELANGERTVQEIARQAGLGEFDTTKAIFHLVEEKVVECTVEAPLQGPEAATERIDPDRVLQAFNLIFRTIHETMARAPTGAQGFHVAVNAYLASDSPHRDLFKDLSLDGFGKLEEVTMLANLSVHPTAQASDDPARFLQVALDDLMRFMLFEAGECLSPDQDEALSKKVQAARAAIQA